MKYNFNVPCLRLDGKCYNDVENGNVDLMLNKVLATNLAHSRNAKDLIKVMEWARTVYNGDVLMLDKSDMATLRSMINGFTDMYAIVKQQLLDVLDCPVKEE